MTVTADGIGVFPATQRESHSHSLSLTLALVGNDHEEERRATAMWMDSPSSVLKHLVYYSESDRVR